MVAWLWSAQRKLGTAVGEEEVADALRVNVKFLWKRLITIADVQEVHRAEGGSCYYAKTSGKTGALRYSMPTRVPKVRPEDPQQVAGDEAGVE